MTDKKPKIWLNSDQTTRFMEVAKSNSPRDYTVFLLCRWGLRIGEVVGRNRLPGLYGRDLRENGVWVLRKHQVNFQLYPLRKDVLDQLVAWIVLDKVGPNEKVFKVTERWMEERAKDYALAAGITEFDLVGPHRFRAFFCTDNDERGVPPFTNRDLMDHKDLRSTNRYIGRKTPGRLLQVLESLPADAAGKEAQTPAAAGGPGTGTTAPA